MEKPLGHDLNSSQQINDAFAEVFNEDQIFRIDHYLGKETVLNLLALRFANSIFTSNWDHNTIDSIQITVAEEVGIEGRWEYFDQTGHWQIDFSSWSKPDKSVEQEQFLQVLDQCISRLPARMAQLFMLREFEDMSSDEICQLMSISSMNNFWVMLSRVRGQLRHCLDLNWNNA